MFAPFRVAINQESGVLWRIGLTDGSGLRSNSADSLAGVVFFLFLLSRVGVIVDMALYRLIAFRALSSTASEESFSDCSFFRDLSALKLEFPLKF